MKIPEWAPKAKRGLDYDSYPLVYALKPAGTTCYMEEMLNQIVKLLLHDLIPRAESTRLVVTSAFCVTGGSDTSRASTSSTRENCRHGHLDSRKIVK